MLTHWTVLPPYRRIAHALPMFYVFTESYLLQILMQFTSGGKGSDRSQNELISMAMVEASKLFDKSNASSEGKQDVVNGAAMAVIMSFLFSPSSRVQLVEATVVESEV